jgi:hypothetical protein
MVTSEFVLAVYQRHPDAGRHTELHLIKPMLRPHRCPALQELLLQPVEEVFILVAHLIFN